MNAKRRSAERARDPQSEVAELLITLLIVQLGQAGLSNEDIRKIVGGDANRVSRIMKFIRAARRREEA